MYDFPNRRPTSRIRSRQAAARQNEGVATDGRQDQALDKFFPVVSSMGEYLVELRLGDTYF